MQRDLHFLGWSAIQIQLGRLRSGKMYWERLNLDWQLGDIRNCSYAPGTDWIGITAEDRTHDQQVLAIYQRRPKVSLILVRKDYLLHHALNQTGSRVCYTRPSTLSGAADLYLYEVGAKQSRCLAKGGAAQNSRPVWFADDTRIAYHSPDGQIVIWDMDQNQHESLVVGQLPAVSPNGNRIAFQKDNQLFIWDNTERRTERLDIFQGWRKRKMTGGLSWSSNGRFLSLGLVAGVTDKSTAFYLVELATGQHQKVTTHHLRDLLIMNQDEQG